MPPSARANTQCSAPAVGTGAQHLAASGAQRRAAERAGRRRRCPAGRPGRRGRRATGPRAGRRRAGSRRRRPSRRPFRRRRGSPCVSSSCTAGSPSPTVSASSAAACQARLSRPVGRSAAPSPLIVKLSCVGPPGLDLVDQIDGVEDVDELVVTVRAQRRRRPRCRLTFAGARTRTTFGGRHPTTLRSGAPTARRNAGSSSFSDHSRNGAWCSPPIWTSATWVKPASVNSLTASTTASTSGAAGDRVGDVVLGDELGGAGEAGGAGQLGVDLPAAAEPAELVVRALDRGVAIGVVADRQLADARLARPAGGVELLAERRVRLDRDHQRRRADRPARTTARPTPRCRCAAADRRRPTAWPSRRGSGCRRS